MHTKLIVEWVRVNVAFDSLRRFNAFVSKKKNKVPFIRSVQKPRIIIIINIKDRLSHGEWVWIMNHDKHAYNVLCDVCNRNAIFFNVRRFSEQNIKFRCVRITQTTTMTAATSLFFLSFLRFHSHNLCAQ